MRCSRGKNKVSKSTRMKQRLASSLAEYSNANNIIKNDLPKN